MPLPRTAVWRPLVRPLDKMGPSAWHRYKLFLLTLKGLRLGHRYLRRDHLGVGRSQMRQWF